MIIDCKPPKSNNSTILTLSENDREFVFSEEDKKDKLFSKVYYFVTLNKVNKLKDVNCLLVNKDLDSWEYNCELLFLNGKSKIIVCNNYGCEYAK